MAQNNIGTFSWTPKKRQQIPINPSLAPPDWRQQLMQPAGPYSSLAAPIFSTPEGGMGNLPRAVLNNLPIPLIAKGLNAVGAGEHALYDWAKTPEGEWVNRGKPAGVPSSPASPSYVLPGAAGASTAAPAASSLSGDQNDPMAKYRTAIAGMESAGSGDYVAVGPYTKSGDRAYGRYQIMGANIPQWTQEALGHSMTPEEFVASPEAQDAVFNHRFGGYLSQGSEAEAARKWFGTGTDVLGTTDSAYVNKFLHALGEPGLPPTVQAFQQGAPPSVPNPEDRPIPTGPDFSSQNAFLNQAAPQAVDPALVKKMEFQRLLAGIGAANANVDVRGPGGTGRLFAAWGAGASGAQAANASDELTRAEELQNQQQDFALHRAGIAGDQSAAEVAWKNQAGDVGFENRSADQRASYENTAKQYDVSQRNAQAGFDATQANQENQFKQGEAAWEASRPKVLDTNAKGIVVQTPEGITMQPWANTAGGITDFFKKSGLPGPLADVAKYDAMEQMRDPVLYKKEIMHDLISSGAGEQVFGANYTNALKAAQDSIDPSLRGDAKVYAEALTKATTEQLWHDLLGNEGWVQNAAAMGNYGAKKLVPQGAQQ